MAAWVELKTRTHSAQTVKQALAAPRHLFDWLVIGQCVTCRISADASLEGRADYLVSVNKKDLLSLGSVQNIPIITARQAVEYLGVVGG